MLELLTATAGTGGQIILIMLPVVTISPDLGADFVCVQERQLYFH